MQSNNTTLKLIRTKIILDEIEKGTYPSIKDLQTKIEQYLENLQYINDSIKRDVSERTIIRDIKEIRLVMNIDVDNCRTNNGYYIRGEYDEATIHDMLDSVQMHFLQSNMPDVKRYIYPATRRAKGTERIFPILKGIKDIKKLSFSYNQYEKQEVTERLVSPLGLKEFKGFWYLIATDDGKGIKTFGLDRIDGLRQTYEKAHPAKNFDLEEYYKHCYGIVRIPNMEAQVIIIKATPIKACYYKANPLHHSQKLIEETEDYSIFSLYMYLSYDLQQELRSHGESQVQVLKPEGALGEERYR